ncbi:MAG: hypothetical protein LKF71_04270 [Oscillospiraceae bacterium]|jgi:hypothetical protein|nr:hypothetical protein [Oscillospiraceae bacterium]
MRKFAVTVLAAVILAVSLLSVGCGISQTAAGNRDFMRTAEWGTYTPGSPATVRFGGQTYTMTSRVAGSDELNERVGVVARDQSRKLYCWIYTIKGQKQNSTIALYNYNNDGKTIVAQKA